MRKSLFSILSTAPSLFPSISAATSQQQRHKQNGFLANTGDACGSARSRVPGVTVAAGDSKSLWLCEAREVAATEVKRDYVNKRFQDKKTRSVVRQRLREEGLTSNFFPILFSHDTALYTYEIEATRLPLNATRPPSGKADTPLICAGGKSGKAITPSRRGKSKMALSEEVAPPFVKRVECSRAWRAVQRYLKCHFPNAAPFVNLRYRVYTTAPLPVTALKLPPESLDVGWVECKMLFKGKVRLAKMESTEVQETINKIVLWALRYDGNLTPGHTFCVAKEASGKVVHMNDVLSVDGLRIFKGTVIRATFVSAGDGVEESPAPLVAVPPPTAELTTLVAGVYEAKPLQFLVEEFVRNFVFKERNVYVYKITDASGTVQASVWDATEEAKLKVGSLYEVTGYRVRVFESRNGMRLVEMTAGKTNFSVVELQGDVSGNLVEKGKHGNTMTGPAVNGTGATKVRRKGGKGEAGGKRAKVGQPQVEQEQPGETSTSESRHDLYAHHPGKLALKIDTKCTVATELSLWEEVKQHFGNGPYDAETEERIVRSVQGTPVVISTTLRHSTVRFVRFNIIPTEVDLEAALQQVIRDLDPKQPYAVLMDYSVVPLQALHCCYDPRMRSWQDITVSSCSFLPTQRIEVIESFRLKLEAGLRRWGITVAPRSLLSKSLSLLPAPEKVGSYTRNKTTNAGMSSNRDWRGSQQATLGGSVLLRHPYPPSSPTTIAVIGITAAHASEGDEKRVNQTTQAIGRYCRTSIVITVPDEQEAVHYLVQQLINADDDKLRDPNSAVVVVTDERETRLARWMRAECLSRGIAPLFVGPCASPKQQQLRCENTRMRMRTVFEPNPLRGVDLQREVPAVAQRRVLLVGVDSCHTPTVSTGSIVGVLCTPERNHLLPFFWKQERRGQEVELVSEHFEVLAGRAAELYDGLDDVVVFQDGDVYSELSAMRAALPAGCGFTFACLHKRSDVRFIHNLDDGGGSHSGKVTAGNAVKGTVVQALTIQRANEDPLFGNAISSFYLQNHECDTSTARPVQYTLYCNSPSLDVSDVQQLSHVVAHVMAPRATKLPMPTRCAHRLASIAERLIDAVPQLQCSMIPKPLSERLWFF